MTTEGRHIYGQFWLEYDYEPDNTVDKLTTLMDEFLDYIIEFAESRNASIPSIMSLEDIHGSSAWRLDGENDEDDDDDEYDSNDERVWEAWDNE